MRLTPRRKGNDSHPAGAQRNRRSSLGAATSIRRSWHWRDQNLLSIHRPHLLGVQCKMCALGNLTSLPEVTYKAQLSLTCRRHRRHCCWKSMVNQGCRSTMSMDNLSVGSGFSMATIRSRLSRLVSAGKNQCGPSCSSSSAPPFNGRSVASALALRPPRFSRTSSYHLRKDWYRGQCSRSSPKGRERKSIAYRMTPADHTSALVPS
mmetsp:Transcript_8073/g.14749  ORF Transcript_8073/g.14749 Transcript_8073/m.14749 type:complete len:206 (-) Transcript_8073:5-622(-)